MNEPKVEDKQICEALLECDGNVSAAAKWLSAELRIPVARQYVAGRISRSSALQEILEDIRETVIDDAESNVFRAVRAGRIEESKFVLTTIGKDRGYFKSLITEDVDAATLARRIQDARAKNKPLRAEYEQI
jgi:hypothetical protein